MLFLSKAQLKEQEVFEYYKKNYPNLLVVPSLSEKEVFSQIGINTSFFSFRHQGYIRFYPQDFIVEEISKDGEISEVASKEKKISPCFPFHLYCDLVKAGISTFDTISFLAETLQIKPGRIAYAGLKDDNGLTSQRFAFLDINSELFEKIKKISQSNLFLTNFSIGKKNILRGDLFGNRFTIFIRTKGKINGKQFAENLENIKEQGFLNFYHIQRFGYPRFLNHIIGKLILQGEYEKAIFNYFTQEGLLETSLIKGKRGEAKRFFGNWGKMEQIFSEFPFTFRKEIDLLSYLKKYPNDFTGALNFFQNQTKFFVYSYSSYLFNQILSLEGLELPKEIPLFLSDDLDDQNVYKFWLEKDETQNFQINLRPFRFLKLQRRFVKTKILPQNILFKIMPEGVALSFNLEKGVYATTFLTNLFELKENLPLPEWIKPKEYDIKKLLGIGSIKAAKKIFGEVISSPMILY